MTTKKPPELSRLAIYCIALLIIMVGTGLATGPDSLSGNPDSAPLPIPRQAPAPLAIAPIPPQQNAPVIAVNQVIPQALWEPWPPAAASPAAAPTFTAADLKNKKLPFQEAHWQGLEVIPLTRGLRKILKIPPEAKGVITDDVTWPADMKGFQAGDLITSVGQLSTPNLESFIKAANRVRDRRRSEIQLLRKGKMHSLVLTAAQNRLGTANGETAPMIKAGSRSPHAYQGPCTQCHRIGTNGQLAMDQGDILSKKAPPIHTGWKRPHRDRGECATCHKIIQ